MRPPGARLALDQVGAEQKVIVGPQQVGDARQEAGTLRRLEVPDRAPEQCDHAWAGERHPLQIPLEVTDEPVDDDPVLRGDRLGHLACDLLRDVDRRVGL